MTTPSLDPAELDGHLAAIYGLCRRLLHDEHLAEDATQETFAAAFPKWSNQRTDTRRSWLLRIAASRSVAHRIEEGLAALRHWMDAPTPDAHTPRRRFEPAQLALLPLLLPSSRLVDTVRHLPHCPTRPGATQGPGAPNGSSGGPVPPATGAGLGATVGAKTALASGTPSPVLTNSLAATRKSAGRTGRRAKLLGAGLAAAALAGFFWWTAHVPAGARATITAAQPLHAPRPTQTPSAAQFAAAPIPPDAPQAVEHPAVPAAPAAPAAPAVPADATPAAGKAAAPETEAEFEARLGTNARKERSELRKKFSRPIVDPDHPDQPAAWVVDALKKQGIDVATLKPGEMELLRLPLSIGWIRYWNVKDITFLEVPSQDVALKMTAHVPIELEGAQACRVTSFSPSHMDLMAPVSLPDAPNAPWPKGSHIDNHVSVYLYGDPILSNLDFFWTAPEPYDTDQILTVNHILADAPLRIKVGLLAIVCRNADANLVEAIRDHAADFGRPGSRNILGNRKDALLTESFYGVVNLLYQITPDESDLTHFSSYGVNANRLPDKFYKLPNVQASPSYRYTVICKEDTLSRLAANINSAPRNPCTVEVDPGVADRTLTYAGEVRTDPDKSPVDRKEAFHQLLMDLAKQANVNLEKTATGWKFTAVPTKPTDGF